MMKKKKIAFSVLDLIFLVLVAVLILSTVFQDQVRSFLGETDDKKVEITFLVENVTESARNHPVAGEKIYLAGNHLPLGELSSVVENKTVYKNVNEEEDTVEILSLTCKATSSAEKGERGYEIAGLFVKPGSTLEAETDSATFQMVVTMVKPMEE